MRQRWAWVSLAGFAALVAVWVVLVLTFSSIPWPDDADSVFVLAGLAPAVVGAVLAIRRPENVIGRLLILIGSAWLLAEASRLYLWMSLHTSLPFIDGAAWLMSWLFAPAWMLIPVLLAFYPSGRVASSWMRWPVRVYVPIVVIATLLQMVLPLSLAEFADYLTEFTNPMGLEALIPLEESGLGLFLVIPSVLTIALLSLVDLIRRWRRSYGHERLQIRAFALGALTMVLLFLVGAALFAMGAPKLLENLTTTLALSAPALAVGFAILRYRLYEIDRLISRTVSYALVAGLLAGVFAAIAIGLPRLIGTPEENPVLVAAAILAAAALFNPLRRRIQRVVDRRFNRARYDAQQEVEHFSERLRAELELDDIAEEMLEVVDKTMQPVSTSMWIRDDH